MAQINYKTILLVLLCTGSMNAMSQTYDRELKNIIGEANQQSDDEAFMKIIKSADSLAKKGNNVAGQAMVARAVAAHFYATDADESIKYQQKAHRLFLTAGMKEEATTSLQNTALTFEEQKKDMDEALKFAKRALNARVEMKDTLEQANMHKYIGQLHSKMRNRDEAKKSIAKARLLYTKKDYQTGLAQIYRNLADIYEEEQEYDSSIAYLLRAREVWKLNPENPNILASRQYSINNDLIRLYTKDKKLDEAETLVKENEPVDATKFHYMEQFNFYKEARDFYSKKKDKENTAIYKDKYTEMREGLKAEGKKVE